MGIAVQVGGEVYPEHLQVRKLAVGMRRYLYQFGELLRFFGAAEFYGAYIYINCHHDPSSSRIHHTPPVLERSGDKGVGGNGNDRIIEILYFYGYKCYVYDDAVGDGVLNGDPIPGLYHIIGGELYSRYKSQNGIFKNEGEQGGEGAQSRKQSGRGFIDNHRYDHNGPYAEDNDLQDLKESFNGFLFIFLFFTYDFIPYFQECIDKHYYNTYGGNDTYSQEDK